MNIIIRARSRLDPGVNEIEIVERKGLGHPDTICDALSEEVSRALSRYYLDHFGRILHHNVDKMLLVGGRSAPRFGGGDIMHPIEIYVAGRATTEWDGHTVPVGDVAHDDCVAWIRTHLREEISRHIRVTPLIRPGSGDLRALFGRGPNQVLANDTSCGAGFAPLSGLERIVLAVEQALNSPATKVRYPAIGEDVKVMGVRHRADIDLTIACAIVDRFVRDAADYNEAKAHVRAIALDTARTVTSLDVTVNVNAADDEATGARYLTVTGTSAEAGDDGETGRGNRTSGLITPYRPMTLEAAAGKNPVTHVGKLYQLMAMDLAARIVADTPDVHAAECLLVSHIGRPVTDPFLIDVAIDDLTHESSTQSQIEQLAGDVLGSVSVLTDDLLHGRRQIC